MLAYLLSLCLVGPREALVPMSLTAVPGQPVLVALQLHHEPGWHSYWVNPGDSGVTVSLELSLPKGWNQGPLEFPVPRVLAGEEGLTSYGYENSAVMFVALTPPKNAPIGSTATLRGTARWMVCKDMCEMRSASLATSVQIAKLVKPNPLWKSEILAQHSRLPKQIKGWRTSAKLLDKSIELRVENLGGGLDLSQPYFFAQTAGTVQHNAKQSFRIEGNELIISLKLSEYAAGTPSHLRGILAADNLPNGIAGIAIDTPLIVRRNK